MIIKIIEVAQEFIDDLDTEMKTKVYEDVDLLNQFGKNLYLPHSRKIGKNLYELRTIGKIQIRLFYGFEDNICYVVHGFIKKTNKISKKEIRTAEFRINQLAPR